MGGGRAADAAPGESIMQPVGVPADPGEPPSDPPAFSRLPTVTLEISSLKLDGSPRLTGENRSHTRVLVEAGTRLPPILVHQDTMRVIDGVHRVQAARLRGERTIDARLFDGDAETAFVYAVQANITHGLPLSLADRRAAAERIIISHPDWSDRAVAAVVGLGARTVGAVRDRLLEGSPRLRARIGRDGRLRPLNFADGRQRAAEVIAERPGASVREIASAAGVSVGTAHDVRQRVRNGEDPVQRSWREPDRPDRPAPAGGGTAGGPAGQPPQPDDSRSPATILAGLKRDPSLRYSETGRSVVRWLGAHFIDAERCARALEVVPPHCRYTIAELMLAYAEVWQQEAERLAAGAQDRRR